MADEIREEWKQHLTPERRANFERKGEELVRTEVWHNVYGDHTKRFAALYWLGEKRKARERREWSTFWLVLTGVVLAAIALAVQVCRG